METNWPSAWSSPPSSASTRADGLHCAAQGGTDPVRSEKAFTEEIERVRAEGISAEELQKAKNQWLAEFYRG